MYDLEERALIRKALASKDLSIDSMWIDGNHQRGDTGGIELDLYLHSGIVKEISLAKAGQNREGNWSGSDGTLTIDKNTGKSTYALWQ